MQYIKAITLFLLHGQIIFNMVVKTSGYQVIQQKHTLSWNHYII